MIAAIDVGLKRIGLALCATSNIATPYPAILKKNRDKAARDVDEFLNFWSVKKLVIGIPASHDETARRIKHFATLLKFDVEIVFQIEDLSSIEAEDLLKGHVKLERDGRIDSLAASIILQRYLAKN